MSSLKFLALSGTTGVTENLYIYEYGSDMIIVDCGVGFPEADMFGVDLIIPDFEYIKKNQDKLRGIVITHGHEDHIGGLPFLMKEIKEVPIYSTKLVSGFIEEKFKDHKLHLKKVNIFSAEKDVINLGVFSITPFRISHSVPDSVGFAIDTPEGRVFHVADFKFDWTPVDGKPFDITKAAMLASRPVLSLACDCLGSTSPGYTESEREIEKRLEPIITRAQGQVFFSTISSNISRMQQALRVAMAQGRKVSFIGRSIDVKGQIAKNFGYLDYPEGLVVPPKALAKLPKNKRMYIISGSYGQEGSALYRVAMGEHDFLKLEKGDTVIFSGDPAPPGSKAAVDFVVDHLIQQDADVHYYDMQEDLHVSGHGCQKDIEMLLALIKPKYLTPIGGTVRHMHAFAQMAEVMGINERNVFQLSAGDVVEFSKDEAKVTDHIPVKNVLVDGLGIGDVGNVVLRDRQVLAEEGIAIALIKFDTNSKKLLMDPEIISRGFVFQGKMQNFLNEVGKELGKEIGRLSQIEPHTIKTRTIDFLEKTLYVETGRRPMVLPVIVEI
jgi:ribonuclease J